jgi:hypothetical protein
MTARLFAIERWAARAPHTRYPALLLALLLLIGLGGGLTGCGGGDATEPAPTELATAQSDAQGGDSRTGAAVLVLPLPGPVLNLDAPALVRVRITGQLLQHAHYAAALQASLALQQPQATEPSAVAARVDGTPAGIDLDYTVHLQLPAGHTPLLALLTVRAFDPATALPSGALARAEATAHWVVDQP